MQFIFFGFVHFDGVFGLFGIGWVFFGVVFFWVFLLGLVLAGVWGFFVVFWFSVLGFFC